MSINNISLNTIQTFDVCARHLNFRIAAEELCITPAAVSYQIKSLQEKLGVSLFRRVGRNIELTEHGAKLFSKTRSGLTHIEQGIIDVSKTTAEGKILRLQSYMSISSRWLIPRMSSFRKKYPNIAIELFTSYIDWDFQADLADIGFVYCENKKAGLHYIPLFQDSLIAVCNPKLLKQGHRIATPEDLLCYPLIATGDGNNDMETWFESAGIKLNPNHIKETIDTHFVTLEAVIAGSGITVIQSLFAQGDIEAENLIQPVEHSVKDQGMWYLVCESWRKKDFRIKRLANWLSSELNKLT